MAVNRWVTATNLARDRHPHSHAPMRVKREVYNPKEGHRECLGGPLQGWPCQGTPSHMPRLAVNPFQGPRGMRRPVIGFVKATWDTKLGTFLCPGGTEAIPRPLSTRSVLSQALCLPRSCSGQLPFGADSQRWVGSRRWRFPWGKEGGGHCSSRFSPIAERSQLHGKGQQVEASVPSSFRLRPCVSTSTRWML